MELKRHTGKIKALGDGSGQIVFATMNVIDKDGDVTLPGAFGRQKAAIVPAHNWGSVPLGHAEVSEVGDEAHAALAFNLESATAKEWYSWLKQDVSSGAPIQEWSYGFTITDSEPGEWEGRPVRILKALKVHEVSPVLVGAGENTRTLAIKSGQRPPLNVQIAEVCESVSDLSRRVAEVREMRLQGKGRDLSEEKLAEVEQLARGFDKILAAAEEVKAAAARGDQDAVLSELTRFHSVRHRVLTRG